jgi:hypothetical protein
MTSETPSKDAPRLALRTVEITDEDETLMFSFVAVDAPPSPRS